MDINFIVRKNCLRWVKKFFQTIISDLYTYIYICNLFFFDFVIIVVVIIFSKKIFEK